MLAVFLPDPLMTFYRMLDLQQVAALPQQAHGELALIVGLVFLAPAGGGQNSTLAVTFSVRGAPTPSRPLPAVLQ